MKFLLLLLLLAAFPSAHAGERQHVAATAQEPPGVALVERLRKGGLVLFFRHADTRGMPCDRSFRIGDRDGQRNISAEGREQSQRIGTAFRELRIPIALPVLAGPVYRARDTAELAFGPTNVHVTDGLLADDYAGGRLSWVLDEHRRLFSDPVATGTNRVLVGHRTPAILVFGSSVGAKAFPEGSALVIEPGGTPRVLGILMLAPVPGGGFHGC
ncbi:MAG TPA: histidine phosphatase family protein [Burkholderiales bacterium]|nr:histidine phosphatase family protein [Burkholderiales bacterium]